MLMGIHACILNINTRIVSIYMQINLVDFVVDFANSGMGFGRIELDGLMDRNSLPNVLSDLVGVIPTGSRLKDRKAHCGGTLIARGSEPPSMELWSFILNEDRPTHSSSQNARHPFFLVLN